MGGGGGGEGGLILAGEQVQSVGECLFGDLDLNLP